MNANVNELSWYACHKRVQAAKIEAVTTVIGASGISTRALVLRLKDSNDKTLPVTHEYMLKHNPQVGGYLVVYEDGYMSYSPAEPFEKGYTLEQNVAPTVWWRAKQPDGSLGPAIEIGTIRDVSSPSAVTPAEIAEENQKLTQMLRMISEQVAGYNLEHQSGGDAIDNISRILNGGSA